MLKIDSKEVPRKRGFIVMGILKKALMAGPVKIVQDQTQSKILNCPDHGEYLGFTSEYLGREMKSECPQCAERERGKELLKNWEEIQERQNKGIFKECCIPPKFQKCSFQNYEVYPSSKGIVEMMKKYVINFDKVRENGTSFLFSGRTRRGKTHLACAVLNNIMRTGHKGIYISAVNYIRKVKRSWTTDSKISEDEIIESYLDYDLMVLDEIGKGQYTEKEKAMLFSIITRRYEEGLPTIGITTRNALQLEKIIEEDAVSRLRTGGGAVIEFKWSEYNQPGIL